MTQITVRVEGHYEIHESPFGRSYEWYPAYATLECDCGEKLTLTGTDSFGPSNAMECVKLTFGLDLV